MASLSAGFLLPLFRVLLDAAGTVTVLSVLALLILPVLKQPAAKVRLIRLALLSCLVLGVVQPLPLPRWTLGWVDAEAPVALPWLDVQGEMRNAKGEMTGTAGSVVAQHSAAGVGTVRRVGGMMATHWREGVAVGYLMCVGVLGLRLLVAAGLLRRMARGSVALSGVSGSVRVSERVDRPVVFGMVRATILVPAVLVGAEDAENLPAVIHHEAGHIRHWDTQWAPFVAAVGTLFFFVPTMWVLRRKMTEAQERLADEYAATRSGGALAYAEALVRVAAFLKGEGRGPRVRGVEGSLVMAAWNAPSDLRVRVTALFSRTFHLETRCRRTVGAGLLAVMVMLTCALSTVSLATPTVNTPLRGAELRGVAYLLSHQEGNGGWMTAVGPAPTALILRSLLQAGIPKTNEAVVAARRYIDSCRQADGGYYVDTEPAYSTAIVLSLYAAMDDANARVRLAEGRKFLEEATKGEATKAAASAKGGMGWYRRSSSNVAPLPMVGGASLDPMEREAGATLSTYGELPYTYWKSMLYAGLSPTDQYQRQATRWLVNNWSIAAHPGTRSADGLYYFYLAAARTLHAAKTERTTDLGGRGHDWRTELQIHLMAAQGADGSWMNAGSSRWLENQPMLVTAYSLLALQESR